MRLLWAGLGMHDAMVCLHSCNNNTVYHCEAALYCIGRYINKCDLTFFQSALHCIQDIPLFSSCIPWESERIRLMTLALLQ